jgi:hypothetical protein
MQLGEALRILSRDAFRQFRFSHNVLIEWQVAKQLRWIFERFMNFFVALTRGSAANGAYCLLYRFALWLIGVCGAEWLPQ